MSEPAVVSPVESTTKPKLLDRLRAAIRLKHYSIRTEQSYVDWAKRYIFFHNKRHPNEMAEGEIRSFLSHFAVDRKVSASTQNQALSAILFLYKEVLKKPLDWIQGVKRAKRSSRLPVVFTRRGPGNSEKPQRHKVAG